MEIIAIEEPPPTGQISISSSLNQLGEYGLEGIQKNVNTFATCLSQVHLIANVKAEMRDEGRVKHFYTHCLLSLL